MSKTKKCSFRYTHTDFFLSNPYHLQKVTTVSDMGRISSAHVACLNISPDRSTSIEPLK